MPRRPLWNASLSSIVRSRSTWWIFLWLLIPTLDRAVATSSNLSLISSVYDQVWDGSELHVDRMLHACHVFAGILEKSSPRAVHRDFRANLKKAEDLVKRSREEDETTATTLKQVLTYERDVIGLHKGSHLKDPSGAVGFLWMRRSLEFQSSMYDGLIRGMSSSEAALRSYNTQLRPYHGPVLRRFYTSFFRYQMPPRESMLRILGKSSDMPSPSMESCDETRVIMDMLGVIKAWNPMLQKWKRDFEDLNLEDAGQA